MSYTADDFFDDVVKKCESIDDVVETPADSRGLVKFLTKLLYLYGEGNVAQGLHRYLLELADYDRHALVLYSGAGLEILGDLPPNTKLVLSSEEL